MDYIRHSADLPLSSVKPELSSVCCQTYFDVVHNWPCRVCFLGQIQCFILLDSVICELLTTVPVHEDKRIYPERKVIMCATFVVYVRSVESLDIDICLSLVCSSGRKP